MRIYFLIPVFNESQNIELLFNNLNKAIADSDKFYVFVDDCSTDNTTDTINNFFKNNFIVIKKEKNCGPGDSFNKGFEWILNDSKNESDLIVTLEGDNTSDLNILPDMIAISNLKYDLVLASVYAQGGGFEKTNFFRKIISLIANMLFRSLFNIRVLTLSSFYRVYHVSLIKKIKEKYNIIIKETGFISMLEILIKAIKVNANIIEVPMLLKSENRKGKSKMKIFKNTLSYIRFLILNKF
ncbi:MAG: glycosyltransferase family 2 protein [Bacteroidales bacterium]|nr:glycosyltransferase family 2 protein [Bacteroidales bacterium]